MKIVFVCLFCVLCSKQVFSETSRLRQEILESADKVTAWQIEYDLVSQELKPGDKVIHRNVALRYPDNLFHWAGNVPYKSRRTWKNDVLQQRTIVAGSKCYWDFPIRRASKTWDCDSKSLLPGSLPQELLWDVLMWWPFTTDSNSLLSTESYTIEDVLRDDAYQFLDSTEEVGEHTCYVLRNEGKGALWFDFKAPAVLRKREWYQRAKNSVWRAELFAHEEIQDGIFCPKKITWTELHAHSIGEFGDPIKQFSALIVSAKFNESVQQDLFHFPDPLPGHIEVTADDYQQIRPGANEYADSILKWVADLPTKPVQTKGISRGELAFHVGLYCFVTVLFFNGAWRWRTNQKRGFDHNLGLNPWASALRLISRNALTSGSDRDTIDAKNESESLTNRTPSEGVKCDT